MNAADSVDVILAKDRDMGAGPWRAMISLMRPCRFCPCFCRDVLTVQHKYGFVTVSLGRGDSSNPSDGLGELDWPRAPIKFPVVRGTKMLPIWTVEGQPEPPGARPE